MNEIWKPVLVYEGLYEVSSLGLVRSLNYRRTGKAKILKPDIVGGGYLQVTLFKNGERKTYLIHRLLYEAFNGKIPEGLDVNHIDECKINNRLDNLNLMTRKENINWGTRNKRVAEKMTNGKLSRPVYQYTLDYVLVRIWSSTAECGRNGFNQRHVSECCRGMLKQHKGYIWSYTPLN